MRFARLAVLPVLLVAAPGCGDDPPPEAKGAFSVTFQDDGPGGPPGCAINQHNTTVGSVTNTSKQTLLANGSEGAEVKCSVTGSSSFTVSGSILQSAKFLDISVSGLSTSATADAPVKGSVAYAGADKTATTYGSKSDKPCEFFFTDAPPQGVAAGRVWVAFKCAELDSDQSQCSLGTSYAIFENCSKGDEEE